MYCYQLNLPDGTTLRYIGATINDAQRIKDWNNPNKPYAGKKTNEARAQYGVSAFTRSVIMIIQAKTINELKQLLKEAETDTIIKYDTVRNGLNSDYGHGSRAPKMKRDASWGRNISKARKGQHNRPMKKVKAIDNLGCFKVYPSIKDASIATSVA